MLPSFEISVEGYRDYYAQKLTLRQARRDLFCMTQLGTIKKLQQIATDERRRTSMTTFNSRVLVLVLASALLSSCAVSDMDPVPSQQGTGSGQPLKS
jgi:hypothetical protein